MTHFLGSMAGQLRRRWLYGLLSVVMAASLVLVSPTPSHSQTVPRWLQLLFRGVQIIQLSNISDNQEVQLGQQINQQLTTRQFRMYGDRSINEYVNQVGQRLVPASDRPNIPYTFQVVDTTQVNAFATMGGFVYVTTGLLKTIDQEAQMAGVLGHEIGHIAARHAVTQMRERAVAAGVATAAGLDRNQAVNIGVELALSRPNSRRDEFEADSKGLATITTAGYAPSGIVTFLEKLGTQRSVPAVLSTHPATADRITRLRQMIDPATANAGTGLDTAAYQARIRPLLRG